MASVDGEDELMDHIVGFYQNLFSSDGTVLDYNAVLGDASVRVFYPSSLDLLSRPLTREEVLTTLKEMHPIKALGPDSFHVLFY